MILDSLDNSKFYCEQHPLFAAAFNFLKTVKESDFENPKTEIAGDNCFALFFKGPGKGSDAIVMEAHKKYIDIQYVMKGSDLMGFKALSECSKIHTEYVDKDDYMLFNDQPETKVLVTKNNFAIFYPADVHAPLIGKDDMLKVVVKVKI